MNPAVANRTASVATKSLHPVDPVESLLRRAVVGDTAVLPELRSLLREPEVVDALGNVARRVEGDLVDRLTGKDLAFREALTMKLATMRDELAGQDATPLERQLVQRVVLCWLVVHGTEYQFARAGEMSQRQAEYWEKRINACHRRYLAAVKMLATVRRLAIPAIVGQVNIGRKQVNVVNVASKAANAANTRPAGQYDAAISNTAS